MSRPPTLTSNMFSALWVQVRESHNFRAAVEEDEANCHLGDPLPSLGASPPLHAGRVEEADHLIRYVYNQISMGHENSINIRHVGKHFCGNLIRRLFFGKRCFVESAAMSDGGPGRDEVEHVDALFALASYGYGFYVSDYFQALASFDLDGRHSSESGQRNGCVSGIVAGSVARRKRSRTCSTCWLLLKMKQDNHCFRLKRSKLR